MPTHWIRVGILGADPATISGAIPEADSCWTYRQHEPFALYLEFDRGETVWVVSVELFQDARARPGVQHGQGDISVRRFGGDYRIKLNTDEGVTHLKAPADRVDDFLMAVDNVRGSVDDVALLVDLAVDQFLWKLEDEF